VRCGVQGVLSLDALTGVVSVNRSLNRDIVTRLSLIVVALDYFNSLSSTGTRYTDYLTVVKRRAVPLRYIAE